jgi:hypothetical protein
MCVLNALHPTPSQLGVDLSAVFYQTGHSRANGTWPAILPPPPLPLDSGRFFRGGFLDCKKYVGHTSSEISHRILDLVNHYQRSLKLRWTRLFLHKTIDKRLLTNETQRCWQNLTRASAPDRGEPAKLFERLQSLQVYKLISFNRCARLGSQDKSMMTLFSESLDPETRKNQSDLIPIRSNSNFHVNEFSKQWQVLRCDCDLPKVRIPKLGCSSVGHFSELPQHHWGRPPHLTFVACHHQRKALISLDWTPPGRWWIVWKNLHGAARDWAADLQSVTYRSMH